ncbi:hypothetical protein HMF8227_01449 [Saliniradius amylolyticus]|uniref:Helicase HerA central domain-containing protein n=1 Tax=Saliniradius amylolyticus TaxID=2183582 RepID=A0A2S2E2Q8_9ALTE|nr:hypothetical protein [Saliniradius amylolyticus]AWL11924.1 hypothetical protein HMF8227_01449 [Saliniradius amylolyticus]
MAINPNNALDSEHITYVAASGNGKGVAINWMGLIPAKPCLAIFDPYGEYQYQNRQGGIGGRAVYHFKTRKAFGRAFATAWKSGKPFRVAYQPQSGCDRAELLWFCQLMWAASDGARRLHVHISELARMVLSSGKESSILGECYTGGRKFGLIMSADFQRSTEVPKTVWSNSPVKVVGGQESMIDAERMKSELSCSLDEVVQLGKLNEAFKVGEDKTRLHYLLKKPGLGNYEKVALNIKPNKPLLARVPAQFKAQSKQYRLINA